MSSVQQSIETRLSALSPLHLQIDNESHMHSGPASDSHFKITLVSDAFSGLRAVARHQKVYGLLQEELQGPVHALALHLYAPDEWQDPAQVPVSPNCMGGSKHDH
ncbi:BolA family protein [uncultured Thalassolituus sp.]|uniref:BolA family protein n=1 Tax=uncultured Thalassolituus sp. TaxID=285273 RepID=UPI002630E424|nr:BolA family protein [uncultured Thalassolituus sp.]